MNVDGRAGVRVALVLATPVTLVVAAGYLAASGAPLWLVVVGMVLAGVVLAAAGAVVGAVQERRVNE